MSLTPNSVITAYSILSTGLLSPVSGQPFTVGSGPRCILEDPSNQYLYTANFNNSSIDGRVIDPKSGALTLLHNSTTFTVTGSPTWCVVSGRAQ